MAYTYADFENAVKKAGMTDGFSQYDLDLAKRYPDAGLTLLSLKQDYRNAATDQQRALANAAANQIRSSYGKYTGGGDGMQYYALDGSQAGDYSPTKYGTRIDDTLDRIGSFGSFHYGAAPTYNNAYQQLQKQMLDEIINRPEFSWSKEEDPTWSSYKKSYLREGDRATANALGQASAASGGRASSYAVNAATQAGDYYAAKLNDVIPTLYQQAYDRYLQDYQMKLSDLGAVNNQEQLDYNRYLTDLSQYNADRSQAYNQYLNDYNMLQSYLGSLQGQDASDYNRYLDSVGRDFSERQYNDQMTQQQLENRLALAQLGGSYGDYSGLNALGITPNNQNIYQAALAAAGRVTPVGSGTGSGEPSSSKNITDKSASDKFNAGDHSDAVIKELLASGYTQADLEAAGYKGNYFKSSGNLTNITSYDSAISYLKNAGVDAGVRSGLMTREEWARRKASMKQYGTGGAEVANYNSYQEYIRDYCEYAAGM